jgi:transcriptional regulator with XRE-family HTH domain
MSYGYSQRIVAANKTADSTLLGVTLGKLCIEQDIPVVDIAEAMGVSRQTVYNWFCGLHAPQAAQVESVKDLIARISKKR